MDMVIGFGAVPSAEVRASAGRDAKPSATSESTARMGTLQRCFLLFMTCLPIFDDEIQPDSLRRNISKNKRAELALVALTLPLAATRLSLSQLGSEPLKDP